MMKALLLALAFTCAAAPGAYAQQQDPPAAPNRPRPEGLTPADVADMLDAYALMQAQNTLALRDDQFADFVTRLKRLQQTRRRNLQARNQILRSIAQLVGPKRGEADESVVGERLQALREHDERAAAELRAAYASLDEILDVRQQARFRVFEDALERRKLDLLMRARAGARGRQQ